MDLFFVVLAKLGNLAAVFKDEEASLDDGDNLMEDVQHYNYMAGPSSDKNEVGMGTIR